MFTIANDLVASFALDMAATSSVLVALIQWSRGEGLRGEADTTGILLILGIIKTLLHRQSAGP